MSGKPKSRSFADLADVVALMMWEPRTVEELATMGGLQKEVARGRMRTLYEAGIVRVAGYRVRSNRPPVVYAMQTKPFADPDTPEVPL